MENRPTVKIKRGEQPPPQSNNVWALLLIGGGVILLLGNLGILAGIGRLWPLLLVGVGAWLLLSRNNPPLELRHERYTAPVDGAASARVKLNLSVGENSIHSLPDTNMLVDADLTFLGDVQFVARGESQKFVSLGQTGGFSMEWINPANWFQGDQYRSLRWDIGLNKNVPIDLDIHGGVGKSRVDLSDLNLSSLDIGGGVGELIVTLPTKADRLDARLRVGVGKLDLTIPTGASADIEVKGGVGSTIINTPASAAVRLVADSGIGDVKVPSRMTRLSGGQSEFNIGKDGTWETPGFADAAQQIVIHYNGGVGELRVV
jgi:hypothetical protein